jgi:hypothetical protein
MAFQLNDLFMTTEPVHCYPMPIAQPAVRTLAVSGIRTQIAEALAVDWLPFPPPDFATKTLLEQLAQQSYQFLLLPLLDQATGEGLDVETLAYEVHARFPGMVIAVDVDNHFAKLPIYLRSWNLHGVYTAGYFLAHKPLPFELQEPMMPVAFSETAMYAQFSQLTATDAPMRWNSLHQASRSFRQAISGIGGTLIAQQPTALLTVWQMNNGDGINKEAIIEQLAASFGVSIESNWAGEIGRYAVWHHSTTSN